MRRRITAAVLAAFAIAVVTGTATSQVSASKHFKSVEAGSSWSKHLKSVR